MSEHQAQGSIRHFRTRKELDPKLCPAIVSLIVIGNALVSYWPMFSLSLLTVPEVFAWHSFLPVSKVTNWQSFFNKEGFLRGEMSTSPVRKLCRLELL